MDLFLFFRGGKPPKTASCSKERGMYWIFILTVEPEIRCRKKSITLCRAFDLSFIKRIINYLDHDVM